MSSGGAGGTGVAGGSSGGGGFDSGGGVGGMNPLGGAGGAAGMSVGGMSGGAGTGTPGGMGGVGGAVGGTGGAVGGIGGAGGAAGASAGPDAGTEPEAPVLDCEQGRDTVMLSPGAFEPPAPTCMAELPADALLSLEMLALAVTVSEQASAAETTWPDRNELSEECGDDDAFYVNNSLGVARLVLCPALCEALAELDSEAFKVELIYGCDPPE